MSSQNNRSSERRSRSQSPDSTTHQRSRTRSRSRQRTAVRSSNQPQSSQNATSRFRSRSRDRRLRAYLSSNDQRSRRQWRRNRPPSPRQLPVTWDRDLTNYLTYMRNQSANVQAPIDNSESRSPNQPVRHSGSGDHTDDT